MEQDNYATEVAHTGDQALKLYQTYDFDVVLLDLFLGPESGLDVLRRLRRCKEDIPIIVMTAFGSMETVAEALQEHAFDFLAKPFRTDEVRHLVKRALESRQQSAAPAGVQEPEPPATSIVGKSAAM